MSIKYSNQENEAAYVKHKKLILKQWWFWILSIMLIVIITIMTAGDGSTSTIFELSKTIYMSKQDIVNKFGSPDEIVRDDKEGYMYAYNNGFMISGDSNGAKEIEIISSAVKAKTKDSYKIMDVTLASSFDENVKRLGTPENYVFIDGKKAAMYLTNEDFLLTFTTEYNSDIISQIKLVNYEDSTESIYLDLTKIIGTIATEKDISNIFNIKDKSTQGNTTLYNLNDFYIAVENSNNTVIKAYITGNNLYNIAGLRINDNLDKAKYLFGKPSFSSEGVKNTTKYIFEYVDDFSNKTTRIHITIKNDTNKIIYMEVGLNKNSYNNFSDMEIGLDNDSLDYENSSEETMLNIEDFLESITSYLPQNWSPPIYEGNGKYILFKNNDTWGDYMAFYIENIDETSIFTKLNTYKDSIGGGIDYEVDYEKSSEGMQVYQIRESYETYSLYDICYDRTNETIHFTTIIDHLDYNGKDLYDTMNLVVDKFEKFLMLSNGTKTFSQSNTEHTDLSANEEVLLETVPGFIKYQSDGFSLLLPTGWSGISSEIEYVISGEKYSLDSIKVPISENYDIVYKSSDLSYNTEINIIPRRKFEERKAFYMFGSSDFKESTVKNADIAYELKAFSNNMLQPSEYKIIALKGDICYIISAYFGGFNTLSVQGSNYDHSKKLLQKYLDDVEIIVSSFELSDKPIEFSTITQNSQDYIRIKDINMPYAVVGN